MSQVADKYGEASLEARLMKAIALVVDTPALPLTAENLAVLLHPTVSRRASAMTLLPRSSGWSATTGFARATMAGSNRRNRRTGRKRVAASTPGRPTRFASGARRSKSGWPA